MVERVEISPDASDPAGDVEAAANQAAEGAIDKQDADLAKTHGIEEESKQEEVTPRPDNVPEKFWDSDKGEVRLEAVLKANAELEKKLGTPREEPTEAPAADSSGEQVDAEGALSKAETAYAENGELSDEDYSELEKVGYGRDLVDRYIAGQEALANSVTQEAYSHAGGEESYKSMLQWGVENLSSEEVKAFDLQVQNPELRSHAIQTMYARYQSEADVEPSLLGGDSSGPGGDYFKTSKEMIAAMSSREYKTDTNFQQEVSRKIQRAEAAGIRLFG